MLCREVIDAYFASESKNINTFCGQRLEFKNAEIATKP